MVLLVEIFLISYSVELLVGGRAGNILGKWQACRIRSFGERTFLDGRV